MTKFQFSSLLPKLQSKIFSQDYSGQLKIDGVNVVDLKNFVSDEGDFSELLRLDEKGHLEVFPEFQLRQINRTQLFPASIKAWHLHLKQDEIWYVPPQYHLVLGLWDLRADSSTANNRRKIILGSGFSQAVLIPRGVAHGSVNHSNEKVQLFYFVNQQFDISNPDEKRLHWDVIGADFWTPERD